MRRDVISDVELEGATDVDEDELLDGLATADSSRFLGIWDGVFFDYQVFDENVLARDLERVERYYRARGYYEAKVTAARIIRVDEHHVKVQIRVFQGEPVLIQGVVDVNGAEKLPVEIGAQVLKAVTMRAGERFDEAAFERTSKAIVNTLGDAGYAFAKVTHHAKVNLATHSAQVSFHVDPGEEARYGKVDIVGLESIPQRPVIANLDIREGRRYSRQELVDAQEALMSLGVFSSVEIREDKSRPESHVVPVRVVVRESALRTVRLGGGARFDVLRLSNHLRVGWEHRNFLGDMRRFSIDARPGVTYFPTRIGRFDAPTRLLPENRIHAELRQPSFLEGRTTGFVAGDYSIYPLLYPLPDGADPEKERIIGYNEVKTSVGVERAFFSHHLFVTPSYNWQANFPFTYQGDKPDGLDVVRVSFPELFAILDFRDDRITPHNGVYVSNSLQVAGFVFGGTVSDVRVRPEVRLYKALTRNKKVVLATRMTTGFLFPSNYGETLDPSNPAARQDPTAPAVIRDQHKLLFRAFYSGGPNSNRGYPFRGVGPHGPVGFLVPTGQDCSLDRLKSDGTPVTVDDLPSACIRPLGGLTLWEASLEVRFPIAGDFTGATFVDASDVTRNVGQIRFTVPHVSVGPGVRYLTPVGPVRLDIGYRVPALQQIGELDIQRQEGDPGTVFGLPMAIHIALGEAF
ncbi:MAG: BamA/TamA family outer membrane protein [Polyangiaceae bacterium]|nr:BamA/TamA family outer membrane protein [Polyangiaceae bacterium]